MAWHLTPDMVLATLLVAVFYLVGLRRRWRKTDRARAWRYLSFFAGLGAIFLALQSPIDPIAERLFLMHQAQHLLLRMVGPMLLMLAAPQALLIAGTPEAVRRFVLMPVIANNAVRGFFGVLTHPAVATILFVGALFFWQIPKFHNLALLNGYLHYLMHVTLLLAGLIFFWCVFDQRPAPLGTRYGVRLMMLWIMILSNIIVGSYLALKRVVLYPAYDELGRLWNYTSLGDEQLGAAVIWIPSSMMGIAALLIVIHMWGRHETKLDERRSSPQTLQAGRHRAPPTTSTELIRQQAPKNRALALGFAAFVIAVFTTAVAIGIISQKIGS